MRLFNYIFTKIEHFLFRSRINLFATIYLNFRSLPLHQAICLPIYVYGRIQFSSLSGKIIIIDSPIKTGMIKIGIRYCRSQGVTRLFNDGQIIFHGEAKILKGCELNVAPNAELSFGKGVMICENIMIFCYEKISIGDFSFIAYHANIFDTDFHYCIDINSFEIRKHTKPITIGKYNWIGNKCTIKKGTTTPDYTIVSGSYSVLCKNYVKDTPPCPILGGIPAKVIGGGKRRVFNWNNQHLLDKYFNNNPDGVYILKDQELDDFCNI